MMNSTEELLRREELLLPERSLFIYKNSIGCLKIPPVVDLSSGYSIRGNLLIVLARGVEHLELPENTYISLKFL